MPSIRVAALQIRSGDDESPDQRMQRVLGLIDASHGADLILLPEIWQVGYFSFDRYAAGAEPLDGEFVGSLAHKARSLSCYIFTGSFVERDGSDLHNTSVLLGPDGQVLATYRKIHLFGYESAESRLLKPGTSPTVIRTEIGTLGLSTCYDLRFPELYRQMVDLGAEVFLVTSAWPYPRLHHWEVFTAARAIENQCYVIACNAVGVNRNATLLGHSRIVDPWGVTVAGAGDDEAVLRGEYDLARVQEFRNQFPALRDRVLR